MAGGRPTKWAKLGVQRQATSVSSLLQDVATITVATSHRYVWRGIKNAHYLLHSSLHRRLEQAGLEVNAANLVARELELLEQARSGGLQYRNGRELSDANLLAMLQHSGASTPLLDVTPDPYVALFFATEPVGEVGPCALIAIRVPGKTEADQAAHTFKGALADVGPNGESIRTIGIYERLHTELHLNSGDAPPILWEAPFVDDRMQAQRGMFLATTAPLNGVDYGSFDADLRSPPEEKISVEHICDHDRGRYVRPQLVVFYLSADMRKSVGRELDRRFGYRTETIYPDLAGFALANASNRAFWSK